MRSVVPEQQQYQVKGQTMVPETRHIQVTITRHFTERMWVIWSNVLDEAPFCNIL